MKFTSWWIPALLAVIPFTPEPFQEPTPIRGYSAQDSRIQRDWEAKFQAVPSTDSLRSYLRTLAARPQFLGSPGGKRNAEWLVEVYRSWGLDAKIETFEVLFPTPKERRVELLAPVRFTAALREPPVRGDHSSTLQSEHLPSYNAYSIDGDVTGPLVFVNYGIPADYDELERRGISVKGAIVIAKYGGSWRGIKPKVAAERGAIGCIIYSDPAQDGFVQGDVYPDGPYRPPHGVQRGSVADMPLYAGDPSTPFVGSVPGVTPLPLDRIESLTKIPVLPISYADAEPLLRQLGGDVVPPAWRGGLPLTYKTGPGPATVRLKVAFDWKRVPLYNVMVTIPGTDAAAEWILRGNHRDGWGAGAEDPLSGTAAQMEELRAFAQLLQQGWKPRRTIVYAAWDGEEQGLLGSTEYVETHRDELRAKAVTYLNTDSNGRGFLSMGGSHSLERFINDVAREVRDPETGLSVWQRNQARAIASGDATTRREARTRRDLRIGALGSGSDYTPFLQHAGIAALNLGFGGHGGSGIYHSIYDSFEHYTRFNDTNFVYGRALAQVVGTAVMRLAGAPVLPHHFIGMADTYGRYIDELKALLVASREAALEQNRQLEEGVFAAVADPRLPRKQPDRAAVAPHLNLTPLDNALTVLQTAAERYESALARTALDRPRPATNRALREVEFALTSTEGLPRRPWYRHHIYAPGFYTGYGVKTMPGVREAIEQGDWAEAEREAARIAERLLAAAAVIDQARAGLD